MKVEFVCKTGFVGADHREIVELDDDCSEEAIELEFKDWLWDQMDCYWEIIKND